MWPFTKKQEKNNEYKDITVDMGNGLFIHKSIDSQKKGDYLKQIRASIREAKANKEIDTELAKLKEFQQFHIDNGFNFGMNEIYRYVNRLTKLGMTDEATKQRRTVDKALSENRIKQKKERIEQLKHFDFIRKKGHDEYRMKPECIKNNDSLKKRSDMDFDAWLYCDNEGGCGCQLYGESEHSLKRKGIDIPK